MLKASVGEVVVIASVSKCSVIKNYNHLIRHAAKPHATFPSVGEGCHG